MPAFTNYDWQVLFYTQAVDNPDNVVSVILDGMAQNHSMLPWLGNLKTFDKHIQQHIIGVLSHGKEVTLYR
jgi:hypothetical protein